MGITYAQAGVDIDKENAAIKNIVAEVSKTLKFRKNKVGESLIGIGHFSGLIRIADGKALALSADGVGSKILVAEAMNKYDTIGIDLVAMNANDIICVGAEPVALLDYLAVQNIDATVAREIGKGLAKGAEIAGISICGGEFATLPEVINGVDLAGMIIGIVDTDKIITGAAIKPGDVVVGLASSGIHSNGLTLARKVLLKNHDIHEKLFGAKSVGEELLTPTKIYVKEIMDAIKKVKVKGLANITGGGLDNLSRITRHGFLIDNLPEPQEVFRVIQEEGKISDDEMYRTFNMGVGFCVVVDESDADDMVKACRKHGTEASVIGKVVSGKGINRR